MVAGISYGRVSGFLSTIKLNVPNSSKIQNTDAVASVNNPPSNQNATSNTIVLGQPQGLFITTGTFSRDAIKEAVRDDAPPIDLIDGDSLADKLKELNLGVATELIEKNYCGRKLVCEHLIWRLSPDAPKF